MLTSIIEKIPHYVSYNSWKPYNFFPHYLYGDNAFQGEK